MGKDDINFTQMAVSYEVVIGGIKRTKSEMSKLDNEIHLLRVAQYSPHTEGRTGVSGNLGKIDLFSVKIDALEGRVQTSVTKTMNAAMKQAKGWQIQVLNEAVTPYGTLRKSKGRGETAGRNDTGHMIKSLSSNVETQKSGSFTSIVGWHGWGLDKKGKREGTGTREEYFLVQEKGNKAGKKGKGESKSKGKGKGRKPIAAANSLGAVIPEVRERLKAELDKLRK